MGNLLGISRSEASSDAGRPALPQVIDKDGQVRHKHYGGSMSDIPPSSEILAVLDELNQVPGEPIE